MKFSRVLSVDPGRITLGALHPEAAGRIIRTKVLSPVYKQHDSRNRLNIALACTTPGVNLYGSYILLLRVLFASLLIVSGALILDNEIIAPENIMDNKIFAWGEIIAGAMLATGLFSRFAMMASAVVFCIIAVKSTIGGEFDMQSIACFIGCAIFLIAGAGKYSLDFLIRKAIIDYALRKRRKMKKDRMSFKAYSVTENG